MAKIYWATIIFLCACSQETEFLLTAQSDNQKYRVDLTIDPKTGNRPLVGHYQNWIIRLHDAGGQPVYPARIAVAGGMPGHGHGLPTQPQVTHYLGDGKYLLEGMKLNMAGEWQLQLAVATPHMQDKLNLSFNASH